MHNSGLVDDRMPTQVAHTNPAWDEQVLVSAAWDETVVDTPAWDETKEVDVEYTYCSECGVEK